MNTAARIRTKCRCVERMLVAKNASYGDSALKPLAIFGSGDAEANIRARLDDKLARVKNSPGAYVENEIIDLIGYLILLLLANEDKQRGKHGK